MRTQVVVETPEAFDKWQQEQLVASKKELNQALAMIPGDGPPAKFLTLHAQQMGINQEVLHQIHK